MLLFLFLQEARRSDSLAEQLAVVEEAHRRAVWEVRQGITDRAQQDVQLLNEKARSQDLESDLAAAHRRHSVLQDELTGVQADLKRMMTRRHGLQSQLQSLLAAGHTCTCGSAPTSPRSSVNT